MKKKYVVRVIILFLCSLVFLGIYKSNKIKEDVALKNSIIKIVEESKEINFAKITNFEWDEMYIFTPYSNPKEILKKEGIKTSNIKFNIVYLDTINMIGFVKSNKLVAYVELPRNYGGEDLTNINKFNKNETVFNISEETILFREK